MVRIKHFKYIPMKKKLILQLILLFSITINVYCDDDTDFLSRHAKGSKCFVLNTGAFTKGFYGSLGYSYYFSKYYFLDGNLSFERGKYNLTNFSSFRLNANNNINYFTFHKTIFCNGHLGLFLGNESISETILNNKSKNSFTYGLYLGTNCEYYITNNFSLNLGINQNFIRKSLIRDSYISIDFGGRFFFGHLF